MLDNIYQDYVRTARAKGCSEGAVIWRHAFRNSLMTVTTITGLSFAGLMGGAYIIESIFSIPGLGVMGVNAITRKDLPYILASLITIGGLFMIIMVVIDICYAALDPRIRSWYGGEAILRRAKKYQEKHKLSEEQLAALPDPVIPEELSAKYYELKEKGGAA